MTGSSVRHFSTRELPDKSRSYDYAAALLEGSFPVQSSLSPSVEAEGQNLGEKSVFRTFGHQLSKAGRARFISRHRLLCGRSLRAHVGSEKRFAKYLKSPSYAIAGS